MLILFVLNTLYIIYYKSFWQPLYFTKSFLLPIASSFIVLLSLSLTYNEISPICQINVLVFILCVPFIHLQTFHKSLTAILMLCIQFSCSISFCLQGCKKSCYQANVIYSCGCFDPKVVDNVPAVMGLLPDDSIIVAPCLNDTEGKYKPPELSWNLRNPANMGWQFAATQCN